MIKSLRLFVGKIQTEVRENQTWDLEGRTLQCLKTMSSNKQTQVGYMHYTHYLSTIFVNENTY